MNNQNDIKSNETIETKEINSEISTEIETENNPNQIEKEENTIEKMNYSVAFLSKCDSILLFIFFFIIANFVLLPLFTLQDEAIQLKRKYPETKQSQNYKDYKYEIEKQREKENLLFISTIENITSQLLKENNQSSVYNYQQIQLLAVDIFFKQNGYIQYNKNNYINMFKM